MWIYWLCSEGLCFDKIFQLEGILQLLFAENAFFRWLGLVLIVSVIQGDNWSFQEQCFSVLRWAVKSLLLSDKSLGSHQPNFF